MDLQRQEYPSMLARLQPIQAVRILNDRITHVRTLNTDVADWLQERRRIEDQYATGLRKLALRQLSTDDIDLGVFTSPWQKLIASTNALAQSHHQFARNIETDVEAPLRDFALSNREMQSMETISGNIQSIAKDLDNANKRADKLKDKGGKAAAGKVANATSSVEEAQAQWDSQSPFVFEQLQAVDEARLDHLRNVLTQYQTHVIELVSAGSKGAEEALNALLNVQTTDEIQHFALKAPGAAPVTTRERRKSRAEQPSSLGAPSTLAPPVPSIAGSASTEDVAHNNRNSSFIAPEKPKSKFGGLKRLGTVIKGRRNSTHPYDQTLSSERKRSSTNLAAKFGSFGKKKDPNALSPQPTGETRPSTSISASTPRPSDSGLAPTLSRTSSERPMETTPLERPKEIPEEPKLVNGNHAADMKSDEPTPVLAAAPTFGESSKTEEPEKPQEGIDAINQAFSEAAALNEGQGQFKVDIRNAPIQEEDGDANAALANVANALRAQAPRRNVGTVRGRRDRNTIILPSPSVPELPKETALAAPALASASSTSLPGTPSPPAQQTSPTVQPAPFKLAHRPSLGPEDHNSDTFSIRSGRSLASSASTTIRHPDMLEPGLNTSIVETISAWFSHGAVTKALQTGEVAMAYNPEDSSDAETETIRFEHFSRLEKVAPNPVFIEPVADKEGTYSLNLSQLHKTTVAFKYQVHLDQSEASSHAPISLKTAWKIEPELALVAISYSLNPAIVSKIPEAVTSITLSNVVLIVHVDRGAAKVVRAQAGNNGLYARDRNVVYWRLPEVKLQKDSEAVLLRARFYTEGEVKPGNVEARWEMTGHQIAALGSGIGISRMESGEKEVDPFADADDSAAPTPTVSWKEVNTIRRLRSGTYVAS